MGALRLTALLVIASGCATEAEDPCDACHPRPPSTVFVTDRGGNAILRYDGVTGEFLDVFAQGETAQIDRPSSVRLGPSGHVYSAGFGRGDVARYDVMSGALMDIFYWDTALLEEPVELAFRGDQLIVLGHDTQNAVVIERDGHATRELGYPLMHAAHDFVLSPDERTMYVATDSHPQRGTAVQAWDLDAGTLVHDFATIDEVATATSIAMRDNGDLYVCDNQRAQIVRLDPATGLVRDIVVAETSGKLKAPVSLDFGPDGALYVLDTVGIHRLDPDSGLELSLLLAVGDGHNKAPRSFTFVTQTAIAAAVAITQR